MVEYYNKNVIDDIDPMIVINPCFEEWYQIVENILLNDEFQKRKLFPHHHNVSVWDHSILVSFRSFVTAKSFNVDVYNTAIAGLLHDFYPWSWIWTEELEELDEGMYLFEIRRKKKGLFDLHGFTHAKAASINYVKFFPELENKVITNSIKRHMFPLNIIPPRYKEGNIITMIDKLNSFNELPSPRVIPSKLKKTFNNKVISKIKRTNRVK